MVQAILFRLTQVTPLLGARLQTPLLVYKYSMTTIELNRQTQKNNMGATTTVDCYSVVHNGWLVIRTTSRRIAQTYRDRLLHGEDSGAENGKSI